MTILRPPDSPWTAGDIFRRPTMRSFLFCCGAILLFVTVVVVVLEFWLPTA